VGRVAMRRKYTKALLEEAVKESVSIAGVLRTLGLREAGGTHAHISRQLRAFSIDTSHFLGCGANRGENHKGSTKCPWNLVLVLRTGGPRQKSFRLRRALIESGRPFRCETARCPVQETWLDKPIHLHVNHKNGNWLDDRAENLEFLCPNCHSQTPNYCGSKGLSDRTSTARYGRAYRVRKRGPVAESADARGLGPRAREGVRVQIPPGPPSFIVPDG
jgi:hypothetical protein